MFKVTVIGHFAYGLQFNDGQTVKTINLANELFRLFGKDRIATIDTHGGVKTLLRAPLDSLKAMRTSNNVIILPAHRGIRVYAMLFSALKILFRNDKIHYVVVGGWLPSTVKKNKLLRDCLVRFDGIYVETKTMMKELTHLGFHNVAVLPNFKEIRIIEKHEIKYEWKEPLKLCTFSRVMAEKGIEDAVNAVRAINTESKRIVYRLDIYGPIDPTEQEWFSQLQESFPDYINYMGVIDSKKSVEILKDYFILLFPTHYFTEGIPGTIIDAYAAGVPVICSRWQNFDDLIDEGKTGFGYDFKDRQGLKTKLLKIANDPLIVNELRENCINRAKDYTPAKAIQSLISAL
ncbi:MAG TPA: glycosyltransferase [Fervidobacterium sp.]|nr:glycosyltransferase [Fervidobacterium sp.]